MYQLLVESMQTTKRYISEKIKKYKSHTLEREREREFGEDVGT